MPIADAVGGVAIIGLACQAASKRRSQDLHSSPWFRRIAAPRCGGADRSHPTSLVRQALDTLSLRFGRCKQKISMRWCVQAYLSALPFAPLVFIKGPRITALFGMWCEAACRARFDVPGGRARFPDNVRRFPRPNQQRPALDIPADDREADSPDHRDGPPAQGSVGIGPSVAGERSSV